MDMQRRIFLFIVLSILIILFYSSLMHQPPPPQPPEKIDIAEEETSPTLVARKDSYFKPVDKESDLSSLPKLEETELLSFDKAEKIIVTTDNYYVVFSTLGAKPISWLIKPFKVSATKPEESFTTDTMIELIPQWLPQDLQREFPLELTLHEFGGGIHNEFRTMLYQATQEVLPTGDIKLEFVSPLNAQNVRIIKTFIFPPSGYVVNYTLRVSNEGDAKLIFDNDGLGLGLLWGAGIGSDKSQLDATEARGINSIFRVGHSVKTAQPKRSKGYSYSGDITWGGLETRFYLAAIISPEASFRQFSAAVKERNLVGLADAELKEIPILPITAELMLPRFILEPGQSFTGAFKVFVGPKSYDVLSAVGYDLQKSLFGWIRPFCVILLKIMQFFYNITLNYGWAIIFLTVLVRIVTYPLTIKSMRIQAKSMAEQQRIKPLIDELNKKYKDNPALRNKKLMELYKEHGINPLAPLRGCLPLLLQMPIFFALYILLMQAIELKEQSFLWIKDLSAPDRLFSFHTSIPLIGSYFNLLPILMGLSQVLISKISTVTAVTDPLQRQMMILMPLFFMIILYNLPSGLVLYWLVSNILQVGQQLIVNKHIKEHLSGQPGLAASK